MLFNADTEHVSSAGREQIRIFAPSKLIFLRSPAPFPGVQTRGQRRDALLSPSHEVIFLLELGKRKKNRESE